MLSEQVLGASESFYSCLQDSQKNMMGNKLGSRESPATVPGYIRSTLYLSFLFFPFKSDSKFLFFHPLNNTHGAVLTLVGYLLLTIDALSSQFGHVNPPETEAFFFPLVAN